MNKAPVDRTLQLEISERTNWQSFYDDRERLCPIFVLAPDENLNEWVRDGILGGQRALDIGCGNGRNAIYLAKQGFAVDAVDQSVSAVRWAREEVGKAGVSVAVHCTSIFDFQHKAGTYDVVYDCGCFHHMPPHQRTRYVELVSSALKPGGAFGLVCFTPEGGNDFSDDEVYERGSLGWGLGYALRRTAGGSSCRSPRRQDCIVLSCLLPQFVQASEPVVDMLSPAVARR